MPNSVECLENIRDDGMGLAKFFDISVHMQNSFTSYRILKD